MDKEHKDLEVKYSTDMLWVLSRDVRFLSSLLLYIDDGNMENNRKIVEDEIAFKKKYITKLIRARKL